MKNCVHKILYNIDMICTLKKKKKNAVLTIIYSVYLYMCNLPNEEMYIKSV